MGKKTFTFLTIFALTVYSAIGASETPERFINKSLYNNVYQSTLNNSSNSGKKVVQASKTNPNPGVPAGNRRIVKRKNIARAATAQPAETKASIQPSPTPPKRRVIPRQNVVRAATVQPTANNRTQNAQRRVVARSATGVQRKRSGTVVRDVTVSTNTGTNVSSQQCFSGYKECMDSYCERTDTAYNRCFCSAKLAQIDAKYQNKIDSLIQQIIKLKYNSNATDAEIKEYWDSTVGTYTQTNPWTTIDNALDINWADTASRIRGQNAFTTGHNYCVQHLRGCSYMLTNMRDAYKSEIERDCTTYEKGLEKIQVAAESVIASYK